MARFPDFTSDIDFTETMVTEQSVFCLPATVSIVLPDQNICIHHQDLKLKIQRINKLAYMLTGSVQMSTWFKHTFLEQHALLLHLYYQHFQTFSLLNSASTTNNITKYYFHIIKCLRLYGPSVKLVSS